MVLLGRVCLFIMALLAADGGRAALIESDTLSNCDSVIYIVGDIETGDDQRFADIAARLPSATVALSSDGGRLIPAIRIGEMIRLKGYSTLVMNGTNCVSSCGLIWLAGSPRLLSATASVGFHASYVGAGSAATESGVGNAMVGRYLTLLNLPERAVIFATTASPNQLNRLNASNFRSLGIDVTLVADVRESTAVVAPPPVVVPPARAPEQAVAHWRDVGNWGVYIDRTIGNMCYVTSSYELGTYLRIGFQDMDNGYVMLADPAWASIREGERYELQMRLDANPIWDMPARTMPLGEQNYLYATFSGASFLTELSQSRQMRVTQQARELVNLALPQATAMVRELLACQTAQHSGSHDRLRK